MFRRSMIGVIAAIVVFLVPALHGAQEPAAQRSFGSGGTVHFVLSEGSYRVSASADDRIRVTSSAHDVSVRLNVNARGTRADVKIAGGSGSDILIELPKRVDIVAALAGGALRINGIEGDADISAEAGDIEVVVKDSQRYGRVDLAVRTGTVSAPAFGGKAGASRSFGWNGDGAYDLRIRTGSGQVTLRK